MKITEYQNVKLGVERVVVGAQEKFRFTIQDEGEVIWFDVPPHVADAIVEKLTRGIHVANKLPFER